MRSNANVYGPVTRSKLDLMGIRFMVAPEDEGTGDKPDDENTPDADTSAPDNSAYEGKIAQLTSDLEAANTALAAKEAELTAAKAANYDLLMAVPGDDADIEANAVGDRDPSDVPVIDGIDGLFVDPKDKD